MKEENKEPWEDEFDKEFMPFKKLGERDCDFYTDINVDVLKLFISKVEERAKREERERIVEMIDKVYEKRGWMPLGFSVDTYNKTLDKIKSLITKDNDNK